MPVQRERPFHEAESRRFVRRKPRIHGCSQLWATQRGIKAGRGTIRKTNEATKASALVVSTRIGECLKLQAWRTEHAANWHSGVQQVKPSLHGDTRTDRDQAVSRRRVGAFYPDPTRFLRMRGNIFEGGSVDISNA